MVTGHLKLSALTDEAGRLADLLEALCRDTLHCAPHDGVVLKDKAEVLDTKWEEVDIRHRSHTGHTPRVRQ